MIELWYPAHAVRDMREEDDVSLDSSSSEGGRD
jgi:hypothetical protein